MVVEERGQGMPCSSLCLLELVLYLGLSLVELELEFDFLDLVEYRHYSCLENMLGNCHYRYSLRILQNYYRERLAYALENC
jgi:hypothetical protein